MTIAETGLGETARDQIKKDLEIAKRVYNNPKAREIVQGWIKNAHTLADKTVLKIGNLFIKEILGLNPKKASWNEIDDRLAGIKSGKVNIETFWGKVNKIAPQMVGGKENLDFLKSVDYGGGAAFRMLGKIAYSPGRWGYGASLVAKLYFGAPA